MATECTNGKSLSSPFTTLILFYELFSHTLEISFLSVFIDRVAASSQDAPLAFSITVVMRVADSTSQTRTRVNEDAQFDLDTWCGKKMTPNTRLIDVFGKWYVWPVGVLGIFFRVFIKKLK